MSTVSTYSLELGDGSVKRWCMPPVPFVPESLRHGPFDHRAARAAGVSEQMLRGASWIRLHARVWVHRDHAMTHLDTITAATLAMPGRAQLSHVSRIQALGLDIGDHAPIHFTVSGDLHLALDGIFLHRTEVLPPLDDVGVTPAAAFVQLCATARLIDAIIVGDWLLHHRHMTVLEVSELATRDRWRPGARQARSVLRHLDGRSRSPKESELRPLIVFSGLPEPEINADVEHGGRRIAIVDFLFRYWRLVLEYEGRQHALDPRQFQIDITRYADLRQASYEYLQVTSAMIDQPKALVLVIYRALVQRGYEGPAPTFSPRWDSLFEPIALPSRGAVGQRRIKGADATLSNRSGSR